MLLKHPKNNYKIVKKVHNIFKKSLLFSTLKKLAQLMPYNRHNDNKIDDNKNKLIIV